MQVTSKQTFRDAAKAKRQELALQFPGLGFVPNVGQERFIRKWDREKPPYIGVFSGGNGTGKTTLLAHFINAICLGPDFCGPWMDRIAFFQELHSRVKRRGYKLVVRILCHADGMKENGAVYQTLMKALPRDHFTFDKGGKSFYSRINIKGSEFCDVIDIKTFDQDKGATAGTTIDVQLSDEPPPEGLYSEMIGRTRGTDGIGGVMMFFLTPLEMAAWMMDQIVEEADDSEICVVNASLWENCKDIAGTRGHLTRDSIERQIAAWKRIDPHTVEARVNGTFAHLSGAIYKLWTPDVHVIEPFPLPTHWPIYCVIDPHDAKPPAVGWFSQGPAGEFMIQEWPDKDFTKLGHMDMTIAQVCQKIKEIESAWPAKVVYRFMDPNKGATRYATNNKTIQQCYAEEGIDCNLSQDDLSVGHSKMNDLLWFDRDRDTGGDNKPRLRVFSHCLNFQRAMARYGIKRKATPGQSLTAQIDTKYKDFADVGRYYAVSRFPYQRADDIVNFASDILSARK